METVVGVWIGSSAIDYVRSSMSRSSLDRRAEEAIRRYQSFEVAEHLGDISKRYQDIFHPRHKPSLVPMRNLLLLIQQAIVLMEQDEKHIQEMLDALEERKAQKSKPQS